MLTYENSPENFAVAILKILVHPGSKSCKCVFCERQPFRKDEMRAAVSPKTQRNCSACERGLRCNTYFQKKKRKSIYLSMNRMNISAQVYDVNFISNKLLNINMECTVETLHYYLTSRLHLIHYKVNIVYLKIWRTWK